MTFLFYGKVLELDSGQGNITLLVDSKPQGRVDGGGDDVVDSGCDDGGVMLML